MKHRAAALLALAFLLATMVLFAVLVSGAFWRWVAAILLAGVAVMAAWTAVTLHRRSCVGSHRRSPLAASCC